VSIDNKRHTAIHEAGHAVVAATLRFDVDEVSVGSEFGGAIQGRSVTSAARYDVPNERLEDAAVVALAGNLAEQALLGKIERVPGIASEREHDEQHLQRLFSVLCPWGSDDVRARCVARARELIDENREAINDLAERLMSGEVVKHFNLHGGNAIQSAAANQTSA
jgi:ATP-dependent Zn protease